MDRDTQPGSIAASDGAAPPVAGDTGAASAAGVLPAIIVSMRPRQWTKNLIVFAALIFSRNLGHADKLALVVLAFVVFCLLSGSVYLINDLVDVERDRLHPRKRTRPLAAGRLSPRVAGLAAGLIAAGCLAGSWAIDPDLAITAACFFGLQLGYSFALKEMVILDAMAIAAGFVLRVVAGAVVIGVGVSPWILLCTALLALFLGLVKRRYELAWIDDAHTHRPSLAHYTEGFLDMMITTVTAATVVAYSLYTFSANDHGSPWMMLTIPFVAYGLFRYLYLVHLKGLGGNPEEILVSDVPLIVNIVAWVAVVVAVLHYH